MSRLFGTDGVRGIANRDLSPELALRVGRAGAYVLSGGKTGGVIVIGRDTRISGDMLEGALKAGICSAGVNVIKAGVIPTPAVALLSRQLGALGGIVISASHNPMEDNGIKYFGSDGYKLPDEVEEELEGYVNNAGVIPAPTGARVGRSSDLPDARRRYMDFLKEVVPVDLSGLNMVIDCANGSSYQVAPHLLREMGARVVPISNRPDGTNINKDCGSTHMERLRDRVLKERADLGLAFDGDADRLLAVDEYGRLVDGDQIMVICARFLKSAGRLAKNTLVTTVMSNMGLHLAMRESGIQVMETVVGDRYVLEECLRIGAKLGGEQSGHILFLDHNTTGDGLMTALQLLNVMKETGKSLSGLAGQMERLPQILENVKVKNKDVIMQSPSLHEAVRGAERRLNGQGRVLVRPSGTEPLLRVMVEGRDLDVLKGLVDEIVTVVKKLA